MGATIHERQNQPVALQRLAAQRYRYGLAKRWYYMRVGGPAVIALAGPVVRLFAPDLSGLLAAAAGLWVFVARLGLRRLQDADVARAAAIQDQFDRDVFGLPPGSVASPLAEDVVADAERLGDQAGLHDWYPDADDNEPRTALVCQRSSVAWAKRQHDKFAVRLYVLTGLLFVAVVGLGVGLDLSLAEFLVALGLPSLPALVTSSEEAAEHRKAAEERRRLEGVIAEAISEDLGPDVVDRVQEDLYRLRLTGPLVPDLFYRRWRDRFETQMRAAARQFRS